MLLLLFCLFTPTRVSNAWGIKCKRLVPTSDETINAVSCVAYTKIVWMSICNTWDTHVYTHNIHICTHTDICVCVYIYVYVCVFTCARNSMLSILSFLTPPPVVLFLSSSSSSAPLQFFFVFIWCCAPLFWHSCLFLPFFLSFFLFLRVGDECVFFKLFCFFGVFKSLVVGGKTSGETVGGPKGPPQSSHANARSALKLFPPLRLRQAFVQSHSGSSMCGVCDYYQWKVGEIFGLLDLGN